MKTISDYLNKAKELTGSDYRTAQTLNVTRATVSNWRKKGSMDNENAAKLAELLKIDPIAIIAASEIGKKPGSEFFWGKWAASIAAMGMILTMAAAISPGRSYAYAGSDICEYRIIDIAENIG